ncbi:MAG: class I SAM-dependent methyltransferase, partial [Methanosarcinaceae archaeon]|nr:class I SAM-dependent methyltransferase [Methanosarcinaceae archaeon]
MVEILSKVDFYTQEGAYIDSIDPTWDEEYFKNYVKDEYETFKRILGDGVGRSILDCTCGRGPQALALARLGWQVTATDLTPASIEVARRRAERENAQIVFDVCDLRTLVHRFTPTFDWVISCMALDNIPEEEGLIQALKGMFTVLKPRGGCYLRLRNIEQVLEDRPRYEFCEERIVPFGRVIRLDDWEYPGEDKIIHICVYLREDTRHPEYWDTVNFAYRRRALRK